VGKGTWKSTTGVLLNKGDKRGCELAQYEVKGFDCCEGECVCAGAREI
jgi:hypothetical protein